MTTQKWKIGIVIVLCSYLTTAQSQNTKTPRTNLEIWHDESLSDSIRCDAVWKESMILLDTASERSFALATELLNFSEKRDYARGKCMAFIPLAMQYRNQNNFDTAFQLLSRGDSIAAEAKDSLMMAEMAANKGMLFLEQGNSYDAVTILNYALKIGGNYSHWKAKPQVLSTIGVIYAAQSKHVKARRHLLLAVQELKLQGDSVGLANAYLNLSRSYTDAGSPEKALEMQTQAIKMLEQSGMRELKCHTHCAAVFSALDAGRVDVAWEHSDSASSIVSELNNTYLYGYTLMDRGYLYRSQMEWENAIKLYKQAILEFEKIEANFLISEILNDISYILVEDDQYDSAQVFLTRTHDFIEEKIENDDFKKDQLTLYFLRLAKLNSKLGNHRSAINNAVEGNRLAQECMQDRIKLDALEHVYEVYKSAGIYDSADIYLEKIMYVKDTMAKNSVAMKLQQLELEQEMEIDSLIAAEKLRDAARQREAILASKRRNQYISLFGASMLIVLTWGTYNRWKSAQSAKQLTDEKLDQLLQYEQLKKVDALVAAQEQERKRIADDLHDKIGGKFSTLRYTWESILPLIKLSDASKNERIGNMNDLMDSLSVDVRTIARDMDKSQAEFELKGALRELEDLIRSSQKINVSFDLDEYPGTDSTIEYELYKMILELVSNTLKYSDASSIMLRIGENENGISLRYEDNGKGFNPNNKNQGLGMRSLQRRAERLKGTIEIKSSPKGGMSAVFEA